MYVCIIHQSADYLLNKECTYLLYVTEFQLSTVG